MVKQRKADAPEPGPVAIEAFPNPLSEAAFTRELCERAQRGEAKAIREIAICVCAYADANRPLPVPYAEAVHDLLQLYAKRLERTPRGKPPKFPSPVSQILQTTAAVVLAQRHVPGKPRTDGGQRRLSVPAAAEKVYLALGLDNADVVLDYLKGKRKLIEEVSKLENAVLFACLNPKVADAIRALISKRGG